MNDNFPNAGQQILRPFLPSPVNTGSEHAVIGVRGVKSSTKLVNGGKVTEVYLDPDSLDLFNPKRPSEFETISAEPIDPRTALVTFSRPARALGFIVEATTTTFEDEIVYRRDTGGLTTHEVHDINLNVRHFFRVIAYNSAGKRYSDTVSAQLLGSLPQPPLNLEVYEVGSNHARIKYDTRDEDLEYEVQYTLNNYNSADAKTESIGLDDRYEIRGLQSSRNYRVRIRARNRNGWSAWSASEEFTTKAPQSAVPQNVKPTPLSDSVIKITFDEATNAQGYQAQIGQGSFVQGEQLYDTGGSLQYSFTGLEASTPYIMRVRAYNQDQGVYVYSDWSATVGATTFNLPLPAPENVVGTVLNNQKASFSWDEVDGSEAYEYHFSYSVPPTNEPIQTANGTSIGLSGLTPNAYVYFRVRAKATNRQSAWSAVAMVYLGSAGVVQRLRALGVGSTNIDLGWDPVPGSTSYEVERGVTPEFTNPVTIYSGPNTTVSDVRLTPYTLYYYRARSIAGNSPLGWSNTLSQRTLVEKPASVSWASGGTVIDGKPVGTEIGTLKASGGQGPYTYFLADVNTYPDNRMVYIQGDKVFVNQVFTTDGAEIGVIARNASGDSDPQRLDILLYLKPRDIRLSNTNISEGSLPGIAIGYFTQRGTEGNVRYSLVAGSGDRDNGSFEIQEEVLRLRQELPTGNYSIRVRATNPYGEADRNFTLTVQEGLPSDPYNVRVEGGVNINWDGGKAPKPKVFEKYENGVFTYRNTTV